MLLLVDLGLRKKLCNVKAYKIIMIILLRGSFIALCKIRYLLANTKKIFGNTRSSVVMVVVYLLFYCSFCRYGFILYVSPAHTSSPSNTWGYLRFPNSGNWKLKTNKSFHWLQGKWSPKLIYSVFWLLLFPEDSDEGNAGFWALQNFLTTPSFTIFCKV